VTDLAQAAATAQTQQQEQQGKRPSLPSLLNAGWVATQMQRQLGGTYEEAQAFVRSILTAVKSAPDLLRCNPESIYGGMFMAAQLGLAIGGGLKQAYLIPRKDRNDDQYGWTASFQIGYPGLIKLATNSGLVVGVDTIRVMEGDKFRKGANSERGKFFDLIDGDNADSPDPDKIKGVIGLVWIRGATKPQWRYLTREQIEARRPDHTKEQNGRNGTYVPNTPWKTDWGPMAEKTAVIEALKFAPKSERLQLAITADDAMVTTSKGSAEMNVKRGDEARESVPRPQIAAGGTADAPNETPDQENATSPVAGEDAGTIIIDTNVPPDDYDAPPEDFWEKSGPELGK
jgi:recombination protein RecT